MKYSMLRRWTALALALLLTLGLAACSVNQDSSVSQGNSGKLGSLKGSSSKTDDISEEKNDGSLDLTGSQAESDNQTEFAFSEEAQAAIDNLFANRQKEIFAVAYLGYREEGDTTDLAAWMHNENPSLAAFWPFLTEIPEEDIVGNHGDYGYLYCVVLLDENIPTTIKSVEWELLGNGARPYYSEPLYCGEVGKPFLLYSTCESFVDDADVVVEFEEEDGFVGIWSPGLYPDGTMSNPLAQHGGYLILDFTHLYDVGDYVPNQDSEWLPPSDIDLADTAWYSDNGWMMDLGFDENAENGSGGVVIYHPVTDENGTYQERDCHGVWWMEDDSLYLDIYDPSGSMVGGLFPVLMSPVGDQLVVMQADDGAVPPFFEEGQTTVGLTLSVG